MSRYIDTVKIEFPIFKSEADETYVKVAINATPTADVRENEHGEWHYCENRTGQDGYVCGKCGEFFPWYYQYYKTPQDFIRRYNFCPGCGAKMKGEKDEQR